VIPSRLRNVLLAAAFLALYAVSIPWYRSSGTVPSIWFGLPDWVVVASAAHVFIAALCSVAWLRRASKEDDQ
jgi:hypothetical protein